MSQSFLEEIPASRLTQDTIRRIYELIDLAKTDPKFQDLVYTITKGAQNKDYMAEVSKIFHWVKKSIRYTRDPYGVELVQDVWSTLDRGRGDCDDMDVIVAAMAEVMGAPTRLITVSTRRDREPCHTYPEAFVNRRWVPLDVTVASSFPGWKPSQGITDRIVWTRKDVGISGYDLENVEGAMGMWKASVREVNLTPGIPNDIAHTYANLPAGTTLISRQNLPDGKISWSNDQVDSPKPGDLPYDPALPIRPFPLPSKIWSFRDRASVPMKIDPWGHMRPWSKNPNAIFPPPTVPEEELMSNVQGLYGLQLGEVAEADIKPLVEAIQRDVSDWVAKKKIQPHQAEDHAKTLVDAVTSGNVSTVRAHPQTAAVVAHIVKKYHGKAGGEEFIEPSLSWMPDPNGITPVLAGIEHGQGFGEFGEFGDSEKEEIVSAIHDDITNQVKSGALPKEAAPIAAEKTVDAIKTGDKRVLKATPKTAHVLRKISDRRSGRAGAPGIARTAATAPHHPVSANMVRGDGSMRDKSYDYYMPDDSLDWIPSLYGMGEGAKIENPALFRKVHAEVLRILPRALKSHGLTRMPARLQGLGDLTAQEAQAAASLSSQITSAISGAVDPADQAAIQKAVDAGVNAALGTAPKPSGVAVNLTGWGVPVATGAVLGTLAYLMSGKKKSGYRRNPRSRGGKKGGKQPLLLWGLGAFAAYLMLKPKAMTGTMPGVQAASTGGIFSTIANLFKPSTSGTPGAGTQLVSSVSKLFSSSPTAPAPTGSAPAPSSNVSSEIITTLPDTTPPPSDSGFVVDLPS